MKYFNDCKTIEDVKSMFKEWAKKLHPDCGGDAEEFKSMMQEYTIAFNRYKDIHVKADGTTYTKETTETANEYASIINAVIHMDGVVIQIIGSWVWLEGETFLYKDQIKDAGFWYSKSKKAWYYTGEKTHNKRRGHYSLDKIKELYGCETVATEEQRKIG